MKALLDTNIVIHREASRGIKQDIGILYKWLDSLHYAKCVHPLSVSELNKHHPGDTLDAFNAKLAAYNVLKTKTALHPEVAKVCTPLDVNENDKNDTLLLNEVYNDRVDILITEDKKIRRKANLLGIGDRVYKVDQFLEKVTAENPELAAYKVLSVKQEYFGDIDINDSFFDSFKEDYPGFERWFNRKSEEVAYTCRSDEGLTAFLYVKREDQDEPYNDIEPAFSKKRRLKIGTFKVIHNGFKIGERFLKIIFDNALRNKVAEVYVTIYDKSDEQKRLIDLLKVFGFSKHGIKQNEDGSELVFVRDMTKDFNAENPKLTYPYISRSARIFLAPIYPKYHTDLFPDSILNNESPLDFVEHEPFRNAIRKVYVCRSQVRDLQSGDVVVFYRTGGYYAGVVTTIGIVESVFTGITAPSDFVRLCRKRSVFTDEELLKHWNYSPSKPFIVNFLYSYSFPKRPNLQRLIEMGVIANAHSVPRGFKQISQEQFESILHEAETDDRIIVD